MEIHGDWFCHACAQSNNPRTKICKCCGRPEEYVEDGYEYALLGDGSKIFRPSHAKKLITDIHETDENNWTVLHNACYLGDVEMVKELLSMGADVLSSTVHGQTPLHFAVQSCNPEIVKSILKKQPEIDAQTTGEKLTPLHLACSHNGGNMAIVTMLVDKGADVSALNILERTPLHFAGAAGRPDIGSFLMRKGCDASRMDLHGWTCRQVAEFERNFDFAEMVVRSKMVDKQSVIKTLPPAEYSGGLWTDIYTEHCNDRAALAAENANHARVEAQIEEARFRIKDRKLEDHLINNNQTESFVTNLQGVSDHYYRRKTGRDKPHDTTYETDPLKKITDAGGISTVRPTKQVESPLKVYTEADYRAEEAAMGGALGSTAALGIGMKYMFSASGSTPKLPCPKSSRSSQFAKAAMSVGRSSQSEQASRTTPAKAAISDALGAPNSTGIGMKGMLGVPKSAPAQPCSTVSQVKIASTVMSGQRFNSIESLRNTPTETSSRTEKATGGTARAAASASNSTGIGMRNMFGSPGSAPSQSCPTASQVKFASTAVNVLKAPTR